MVNMKRFFALLTLIGLLIPSMVFAQPNKKEKLKVLYVGGTPDFELFGAEGKYTQEQIDKSAKERMASFEKYLNEYFTTVKVVNAVDYTQDMSNDYDVTVMDGKPNPVRAAVGDYQHGVFNDPMYVTEDFSRPILTIGYLGNEIGRSVGTKNDWYCLCLFSFAHSWRADHPIFKGPFKVSLNVEDRKTPEPIYSFPHRFKDGKVPDTMKMWRVQNYDIGDGSTDIRVGMVSRPGGYEDSPEAEYISSGECQKSPDAVAIGRHGNWLHWGFAASPKNLTDNAKQVLANAIVYISKFANQTPIARKYDDRICTRSHAKDQRQFVSRESYEQKQLSMKAFAEQAKKLQEEAIAKQKKSEKLTQIDQFYLNYQESPEQSYDEYLQQIDQKLYKLYGTDIDKYIQYYDDNYDYFYADGYNLLIDESAKKLGIANNNKEILNKAIEVLEGNSKEISRDEAKGLLKRYTLVYFANPSQWRKWYNDNCNNMFFSESAGWVYLINSREPGVNDYLGKTKRDIADGVKRGETNDDSPVAVTYSTTFMKDGYWLLTVKFAIQNGYHIYSNVASVDPYIATKVEVKYPEGCSAAGTMTSTAPQFFNQSGTTVYSNEAVYQIPFNGKYGDKIELTVDYQCCDSSICFPPANKTYSIVVSPDRKN